MYFHPDLLWLSSLVFPGRFTKKNVIACPILCLLWKSKGSLSGSVTVQGTGSNTGDDTKGLILFQD